MVVVDSFHGKSSLKIATCLCCVLQLVQPGTWLQDLCQERYEVREKKTSKKVFHLLLLLSLFLHMRKVVFFFTIEKSPRASVHGSKLDG